MRENNNNYNFLIVLIFISICLKSIVLSQTILSSCDFQKYAINGCEDELGADCDKTANLCRCKPGNWYIIDKRFCFPNQCPKGQYYDHNLSRCEHQRKANSNSEENYCKHDFHCKGDNIHCQSINQWNYRCVCKQGFVYNTTTTDCQKIRLPSVKEIPGYCHKDQDCDETRLRNLVCSDQYSCQCAQGFTFNTNIDGCEDNNEIAKRDSQTKKFIFLFIGLGLLFGAVLSLKFGADTSRTTEVLLLSRIIDQRRQQREQQRQQQQRLPLQQSPEQEQLNGPEIVVETEPIDKNKFNI